VVEKKQLALHLGHRHQAGSVCCARAAILTWVVASGKDEGGHFDWRAMEWLERSDLLKDF
jgi:hypothetical protein